MVEQRQSAMQRIQVGLVGLVVVLLFVSIANMVLDRVTGSVDKASLPESSQATVVKEVPPDEPLAELGVTPVAKDGSGEKARTEAAPGTVQPR
ncbi:MAG: hypothetical protein IBJ12_04320 [Sphingomonadaceae bacterium]|nr:hypothetical protein [Sphingomonadaceae bacterium]